MPASSLTDEEYLTAAVVAHLVTDFRVWVHRRVEQMELVDDVAVIRRQSIDFTVPREVDGLPVGGALLADGEAFVPLTFLKKQRLRGFDLRDGAGGPLPILSRRENGALATNVLISQAEVILGAPLPAEMRGALHTVAEAPEDEAREAINSWGRHADDGRNPFQQQWAALVARQGFVDLGEALVADFIVCACSDPRPGARQIFKLAYEEPFAQRTSRLLPWRWTVLEFDTPQTTMADSYHLEMAAPPDMAVDAGRLHLARLAPTQTPAPDDDLDLPEGNRLHLYVSQVPQDVRSTAWVWLQARPEGNLRAAFFASALCTALLWLLFTHLRAASNSAHNQISAGLLLLGPTLLTAAVVRPGEHRLVTRVFFWIRVLTVVSLLCCLLAVLLLVGAWAEHQHDVWLGAAIVSSLSTALLLLALGPRAPV